MALNKEKYHLVGTPRVYCSLIQYLKAIGMKSVNRHTYLTNDDSIGGWGSQVTGSVWDGNPVNVKQREILNPHLLSDTWYTISEGILFGREVSEENGNSYLDSIIEPMSDDVRKLLQSVNYFGIMSQNIDDFVSGSGKVELFTNVSGGIKAISEAIIGTTVTNTAQAGNGTFLAKITGWNGDISDTHGFSIKSWLGENDPTGQFLEFSDFQVGHYYDFPHSPNLSVSVSYSFDGIKRKRTMGGTDLTQINYLKPSWGRFEPFSTTLASDSQDFTDVSLKGRRIIEMSFDFINESDMFPKNLHQNTFVQDYYNGEGNYAGFEYDEGGHNANILGNYLNLTLGGNLTHILQLDSEQHDFVLVKLDGKATKITQKSPNLYSVKLKFIEQF